MVDLNILIININKQLYIKITINNIMDIIFNLLVNNIILLHKNTKKVINPFVKDLIKNSFLVKVKYYIFSI